MKKNFRSLELIAKKYLDTFSSGIHGTLLKDSLIEVDVIREYQPGDKRLDSKSSLKTGKTMSRVFNPERSLNLFIMLDVSSSQYTKLESAVITALYMSYLGDICNEKIGLCVFSDHVTSVVDVTDDYSSVVGTIEKSLQSLKMDSVTSVNDAVNKVSNLFLSNSLIVLISDFCYPLNDKLLNDVKKMALLPTNNFVSVVLHNPNDWMLSVSESFNITLKDAESGQVSNFNLKSAQAQYDKWQANLKTKLARCNSDVVFLNVKEERFLLPLIKYLMRT
jgi:uncharacterized protein (DUF58 family)